MSEILYIYSIYYLRAREEDDDTLTVLLESSIRLWYTERMNINFLFQILYYAGSHHLIEVFNSFICGGKISDSKEWNGSSIGILLKGVAQKKRWKEIGNELRRSSSSTKSFFFRLKNSILDFFDDINYDIFDISIPKLKLQTKAKKEEPPIVIKDPGIFISKLSYFRSKIANLSKKIKRLNEQLKIAQENMLDYEIRLLNPPSLKEIVEQTFDPISSNIVCESIENRGKGTHSTYNEKSKIFWIEKYARGIQIFSQVSKILHGPSISTVQRWIHDYECPKSIDLKEISKSDNIVSYFTQKLHPISKNCVLSVDAIKLDEDLTIRQDNIMGVKIKGIIDEKIEKPPFIGYASNPHIFKKIIDFYQEKKQIISYAYIFYVAFLDNSKCFPVHYFFSSNGVGNKEVTKIAKELVRGIEKIGFVVRFIGSDSDPAYNKKKINFFDEILRKIFHNQDNLEIDINVHNFTFNKVHWCDDGSHILKRIRARLVKYRTLCIVPGAQSFVDTSFFLKDCYDIIAKSALDSRSIFAMDDWHPSQIYSSEVFYESIQSQNWTLVLYLSPMVSLNLVLRSKNLTRENLLYICYFGFFPCSIFILKLKLPNIQRKLMEHTYFLLCNKLSHIVITWLLT